MTGVDRLTVYDKGSVIVAIGAAQGKGVAHSDILNADVSVTYSCNNEPIVVFVAKDGRWDVVVAFVGDKVVSVKLGLANCRLLS